MAGTKLQRLTHGFVHVSDFESSSDFAHSPNPIRLEIESAKQTDREAEYGGQGTQEEEEEEEEIKERKKERHA